MNRQIESQSVKLGKTATRQEEDKCSAFIYQKNESEWYKWNALWTDEKQMELSGQHASISLPTSFIKYTFLPR